MINWKAVLIGTIVFVVLGLAFGYINNVIGFFGGILGGLVSSYIAKTKNIGEGAVTGVLSGFFGGIIELVLFTTVFTAVYQGVFLTGPGAQFGAIAMIGIIIFSIVLGLIGGVVGYFIFKKKN